MSSRLARKAIRRQRRQEKRKGAMATEVKKATDAALAAFDEMDKAIKSIRVTPPEGVMLARGFENLARSYDECLMLLNGPRKLSVVKDEAESTSAEIVEPEGNQGPLLCTCGHMAKSHKFEDPDLKGTCDVSDCGCVEFVKPLAPAGVA